MFRSKYLLLFLCLLAQASLKAQINLSFWQGLSTQRADSTARPTVINIGIQSKQYKLQGLSLNILGANTITDANGIQAAGLFNLVGNNAKALQLAGVTNVTGGNFTGLSLSGMVNVVGNEARGVMGTGLINIIGAHQQGIAVAGLLNITGGNTNGIQLSGIGNIASAKANGLQMSGIFNIATGNVHGMQVASLLNLAGSKFSGVQVGAMNVAIEATGVQIGLVNYYRKSLKGIQLGLVNLNPNTRKQLLLSAGSSTFGQAGIRFKNQNTYTQLLVGSKFHKLHPFNISFTYRAGLSIPIVQRLELSGDLGYQHIETFKKHSSYPSRLYNLQARLNAEYELNEKLALIFSGGYERSYTYKHSHNWHKGFFLEVSTAIDLTKR